MATPTPAVFLDRDGTLNVEKNYLHRIEDWEWIPGAVEAIRRLNAAGYTVVVVTNQAGIARGLYGEAEVAALHDFVYRDLARRGARVDAFYHCPHHPDHGSACDCRKPAPGMILQAAAELGLDLGRSWLVGDKVSDVEAARAAGVRPILVRTGYGASEEAETDSAEVVDDIGGAIETILRYGKTEDGIQAGIR